MKKLHYFNQYLYESMQGSIDPKAAEIIRNVHQNLDLSTVKDMVDDLLVHIDLIQMLEIKEISHEWTIPNIMSFYKEYLNGNPDIMAGYEQMKINGQGLIDIVNGAAGQPATGSGNTKGNKGVETGNLGYPAGKNLYESNDDMNPWLALIIIIALFILSLFFNDPSIGVH